MHLGAKAITGRVIELLVNPAATWQTIREENEPGRELVLRLVGLLAAAACACMFLGNLLFGSGLLYSLSYAALLLVVLVSSVYFLGWLTNSAAPSFATVRNEDAALRLAAYTSVPVWVAGLATLVPTLLPVAVPAGFGYAAYLFFRGCTVLMGTPPEKALRYSVFSVAAWLAAVLVAAMVLSRLAALLFAPVLVLHQLDQLGQGPPAPMAH